MCFLVAGRSGESAPADRRGHQELRVQQQSESPSPVACAGQSAVPGRQPRHPDFDQFHTSAHALNQLVVRRRERDKERQVAHIIAVVVIVISLLGRFFRSFSFCLSLQTIVRSFKKTNKQTNKSRRGLHRRTARQQTRLFSLLLLFFCLVLQCPQAMRFV